MARALSKAGGVARHAAQRISPSSATPNGKPQQAQQGPSRKVTLLQQSAQKPASLTCPRQPMQSGGNRRSSSALATGGAIAANLARMTQERAPLFDFAAKQRAQKRASHLAGDRFLDTAALEGLTDRLAPVTRRFERGLWIGEEVPAPIRPFAQVWQCADFDAEEILKTAPSDEKGPFDLAVSLFSLQWINDLPGA